MDGVKAFNSELASLYESKPPVSKARMTSITKAAMKAIKYYKHVVLSVEKFIQKCKIEYKIPGLYVIDSIVRQSRHQFGVAKDVFGPRFAKNLESTAKSLLECSEDDKVKVIRVLKLWLKNSVFTEQDIRPILIAVGATDLDSSQESMDRPSRSSGPRYTPSKVTNSHQKDSNHSGRSVQNGSRKEVDEEVEKSDFQNQNLNPSSSAGGSDKPLDPAFLEQIQQLTSTLITAQQQQKKEKKIKHLLSAGFEYSDESEGEVEEEGEVGDVVASAADELLKNPQILQQIQQMQQERMQKSSNTSTPQAPLDHSTSFKHQDNAAAQPPQLQTHTHAQQPEQQLQQRHVLATGTGHHYSVPPPSIPSAQTQQASRGMHPVNLSVPPPTHFSTHQPPPTATSAIPIPTSFNVPPPPVPPGFEQPPPNAFSGGADYERGVDGQDWKDGEGIFGDDRDERRHRKDKDRDDRHRKSSKRKRSHSRSSRDRDRESKDRHHKHSRRSSEQERGGDRDKDRDREDRKIRKKKRSRSRSGERRDKEKERERRKLGLPPVKPNHVAICSRMVWFGRIPTFCQENDIKEAIKEVGEPDNIDFVPPRGCAYITMPDRKSAYKIIHKMKDIQIKHKSIKVDWSQGKGTKTVEYKEMWDPDKGVTYIPFTRLPTDLTPLLNGGFLDLESLPPDLQGKYQEMGKADEPESTEQPQTQTEGTPNKEETQSVEALPIPSAAEIPMPIPHPQMAPPPFGMPPPGMGPPGGFPFPPPFMNPMMVPPHMRPPSMPVPAPIQHPRVQMNMENPMFPPRGAFPPRGRGRGGMMGWGDRGGPRGDWSMRGGQPMGFFLPRGGPRRGGHWDPRGSGPPTGLPPSGLPELPPPWAESDAEPEAVHSQPEPGENTEAEAVETPALPMTFGGVSSNEEDTEAEASEEPKAAPAEEEREERHASRDRSGGGWGERRDSQRDGHREPRRPSSDWEPRRGGREGGGGDWGRDSGRDGRSRGSRDSRSSRDDRSDSRDQRDSSSRGDRDRDRDRGSDRRSSRWGSDSRDTPSGSNPTPKEPVEMDPEMAAMAALGLPVGFGGNEDKDPGAWISTAKEIPAVSSERREEAEGGGGDGPDGAREWRESEFVDDADN